MVLEASKINPVCKIKVGFYWRPGKPMEGEKSIKRY